VENTVEELGMIIFVSVV